MFILYRRNPWVELHSADSIHRLEAYLFTSGLLLNHDLEEFIILEVKP